MPSSSAAAEVDYASLLDPSLSLPGPSNYHSLPPFPHPFNHNLVDPAQNPHTPPLPTQATSHAAHADPLMWAMSSRLPLVEETSPPSSLRGPGRAADKVVKISWFRPHGQTAYAPGLKRITLKVRIDTPEEALQRLSPRVAVVGPDSVGSAGPSGPGPAPGPSTGSAGAMGACGSGTEANVQLLAPDGYPDPGIMRHLLDVFGVYFGCQFPFLDTDELRGKIEARTANVFLLNCIAGLSASHPAIARPDLEPWAYGNVFYHRAKAMLGSMLSVPSREAVLGFVLLAHIAFANDVESEIWMLTGMAVRMALDMGLHLLPSATDSDYSADERRQNRLLFASVMIMDYSLAFGVGRQTAWRVEDITQALPTADECGAVFPWAAKMMLSYGPIINMLNREQGVGEDAGVREQQINEARMGAIRLYNSLPGDMQWNVGNLQRHCKTNQGPIFVHMHLWMHTILASGFLVHRSGTSTPTSLWRNSARTIGDILVLSDIISPASYLALPFAVQPFYVASCCYVKEIEQGHMADGAVDLSRALLTSVATTNISTLQTGLTKQATYWSGVRWILGTLEKRIEGFQDVDLGGITEKLQSLINLPDAGLVGRGTEVEVDAAVIDPALMGMGGTSSANEDRGGQGPAIDSASATASASASAMANGSGFGMAEMGQSGAQAYADGAGSEGLLTLNPEPVSAPSGIADLSAHPPSSLFLSAEQRAVYSAADHAAVAMPGVAVPHGSHALAGLAMGMLNGSAADGYGDGDGVGAQQLPSASASASAPAPPLAPPSSLFPSDFDFLSMPFDLGNPEGTQTITDLPADAWLTDWFK